MNTYRTTTFKNGVVVEFGYDADDHVFNVVESKGQGAIVSRWAMSQLMDGCGSDKYETEVIAIGQPVEIVEPFISDSTTRALIADFNKVTARIRHDARAPLNVLFDTLLTALNDRTQRVNVDPEHYDDVSVTLSGKRLKLEYIERVCDLFQPFTLNAINHKKRLIRPAMPIDACIFDGYWTNALRTNSHKYAGEIG